MATGAFFEPKALCGSTSGRPATDCGAGGREAALATTTGVGIIEGSDSVLELNVADDGCAIGCAAGGPGSGDLCKEGRSSAHAPRKPTLKIPAKMRRRFTRSSETVRATCPCGVRNRILPLNRRKVSAVPA